MKKNSYLLSCLAIAVSSACHAEVLTYPDPLGSSQSDFGGTGLLQMPNARIALMNPLMILVKIIKLRWI
ncbi:hypothetical protein FSH13_018665, partial [Escherichia coli]|nr:hypothetical protein [Escherichia coli]